MAATRQAHRLTLRPVPAAALAAVLAGGCAHVEPPPGGPVDTVPPAVTAAYPAPGEKAFPADAPVVLQFSEWIEREAGRGRVLLSPPLPGRLQVEVDGNRLGVRPPKAAGGWRPGTAYRLTVLGALKDLRGVPMGRNFSLAFATGADFDSGAASGRILAQEAGGPLLAALYRIDGRPGAVWARDPAAQKEFRPDSQPNPFGELPAFVTAADSAGAFAFDSVSQGSYALLAFSDRNGNLAPDPGMETMAVGALDLALRPRASRQGLRLAAVDTLPLRLRSLRFQRDTAAAGGFWGALRLQFSRPPHPISAADPRNYRLTGSKGDSLPVQAAGWDPVDKEWVALALFPDSGRYRLRADVADLAGRGRDTAASEFSASDTASSDPWRLTFLEGPDAAGLRHPAAAEALVPAAEYRLRSSRILSPPRWRVLQERLEAMLDTLPARIMFEAAGPRQFGMALDPPPRPGQILRLRLKPAAGDTLRADLATGRFADSASLAVLRFSVPDSWKGRVFLLRGGDRERLLPPAVDTVRARVPAGEYRLATFADRDGDRVWHPGSLQPWTPQESWRVIADSLRLTGGGVFDLSTKLAEAAGNGD